MTDIETGKAHVPRVHIVGRKNAGKTTLVCELVRELCRQGIRVATVKHTHHAHELDTPGKDSHQHREAGAAGVGILSPKMKAAFVPCDRYSASTDRYAEFDVMFSDCELIIVEGDLNSSQAKVEVWRKIVGEPPYAANDASIAAVITDDDVSVSTECIPRSDIESISRRIFELAQSAT